MTNSEITAIATSAIALVAVVVAIWQGIEHRRHNRLSVRPHLNFHLDFVSSEDIWGASITNNGPGPAFIEEFVILVGKRKISQADEGWLVALYPPAPALPRLESIFLVPGDSIRPGECAWLLSMRRQDAARDEIKALHDKLWTVSVFIRYRSLYDESWSATFSCGWLWNES